MLRYCSVIQRWRSSQSIFGKSHVKKKNQWHFRLRHLNWDTSGNLVLFLVSVWLHKGFGGISNGFVLLLLHAVVLSEAMMMCSTAIRWVWDFTAPFAQLFSCPSQSQNKALIQIMFSYSSSGRNLLSHHCVREQKQVYFGPMKVGKFVSLFFQFLWNLLKLFSPAITTWSVMHRTVRTVPNRSHLSPAWRCSLLWCRYGPHMTAEADHKVQEYCYLPRLSDPELLDFAFKQDFFSTLRRTKNNRGKTGHQIERVSYH